MDQLKREYKNREYSDETKEIILTHIVNAGKFGISNKELTLETGLDRNIVSAICKKLSEDSYILIKSFRRTKTYIPTQKSLEFHCYKSLIYGRKVNKLISKEITSDEKLSSLVSLYESHLSILSKLKNKERLKVADHFIIFLQDYILKVGTIYIFTLITATSPEFIKKNLGREFKSTEVINWFVNEWIKNSFYSSGFVSEFKKFVNSIQVGNHESDTNNNNNVLMLGLDKQKAKIIHNEFKYLYSKLYDSLNKIVSEVDVNLIEEQNNWRKIICNHKFRTLSNNLDTKTNSVNRLMNHESYILQCKKCDEIIPVNKTIDNESIIKLLDFSNPQKESKRRSKNYRKRRLEFKDLYISPKVFRCENNKHVVEKIPKSVTEFIEKKELVEEYRCLVCHSIGRTTIFDKSVVEKILVEVEDIVGADKKSIGLLNSIANFIYQRKGCNVLTTRKDITPEALEINLPFFKKKYSLTKFIKDRDMIIDILYRFGFLEYSSKSKLKFILSYHPFSNSS